MKQQQIRIPSIVIPKGIRIEDYIDMDDGEYFDEPPIKEDEVDIKFE